MCFYAVKFPIEVQAYYFDPENNFEEIKESIKYKNFGDVTIFSFIYGLTNEEKQQSLVYATNENSYGLIFDFENGFSEPKTILNSGQMIMDLFTS